MSIAITTSSAAAPSSDGPAPAPSGTSKSSESAVPFDAMLDDQTEADQGAGQDVGNPGAPATAAPSGTPQSAPDPRSALLGAYVHGARGLLDIDAELARALAAVKTGDHGPNAPGDANGAVLTLLAPVEQRPPVILMGPGPEDADSSAENVPIPSEIEGRLLQMFLSEHASAQTPAVEKQDDPRSGIADPWGKAVSENVQAGSLPSDVATFRQGPPPAVAALVDAIRLATNAGTSSDRDPDSNQQPMTMGFDRSNARGARAIHLVQPVGTFETTLGSTPPSSVAAPASSATLPNEANVASSIVQSMRLQLRDGVGTAVVHLEPDYLGAVTIGLRVEGGVVTATLHADNPQVRAWMEANEPMLRQGLSAQGLSLDRLLISDERVQQERSADRQHQQQQEPPPRQKPRRGDSGTFEVVV